MQVNFEKYHGLGNDFIFISHRQLANFKTLSELRTFVVKICCRLFSVGADGVVFFRTLKSSKRIEILIVNSDGSFAATCGNALRCLGLKLFQEKIWNGQKSLHVFRLDLPLNLNQNIPQHLTQRLPQNVKQSEVLNSDELFALETKKSFAKLLKLNSQSQFSAAIDVVFEPAKKISYCDLEQQAQLKSAVEVTLKCAPVFVELENPHLVFFSSKFKNFSTQDFCEFGQYVQKKRNVNVSMVTVDDEHNASRSSEGNTRSNLTFTLHVYERGAGLTQACGSGAVASALALQFSGFVQNLEHPVELSMPGGRITVFCYDNELVLSASAAHVFDGRCHQTV